MFDQHRQQRQQQHNRLRKQQQLTPQKIKRKLGEASYSGSPRQPLSLAQQKPPHPSRRTSAEVITSPLSQRSNSVAAGSDDWQNQFFRTKLCPYNAEGRCVNGVGCRFAHSPLEVRPLPNLQRTKLCEAFVKRGFCVNHATCPFAHHPSELRTSSYSFYKVALCNFFRKGRCWNGTHCRFAHGVAELQQLNSVGTGSTAATASGGFQAPRFPELDLSALQEQNLIVNHVSRSARGAPWDRLLSDHGPHHLDSLGSQAAASFSLPRNSFSHWDLSPAAAAVAAATLEPPQAPRLLPPPTEQFVSELLMLLDNNSAAPPPTSMKPQMPLAAASATAAATTEPTCSSGSEDESGSFWAYDENDENDEDDEDENSISKPPTNPRTT